MCEAGKVACYIRSSLLCRHHTSHSLHLIKTYAVCCCRLFKHYLTRLHIYLNLIVLKRLPYSTMPKTKGGWKKKVPRSVILSTLSDTDDPAPSPVPSLSSVPAPSPAPAIAPSPAPAPADEVISSTPTRLEGLTQDSSPSSQPPAKRQKKQLRQLTHEEEDDMAEWLNSNPCLYNKKLEDYRKTDMKQHLWEDKAAEFPNVDVTYLLEPVLASCKRFPLDLEPRS